MLLRQWKLTDEVIRRLYSFFWILRGVREEQVSPADLYLSVQLLGTLDGIIVGLLGGSEGVLGGLDVMLLLSGDDAVELSLGDCVVELTPGIVHGGLKVVEHLGVYVLAGGTLLAFLSLGSLFALRPSGGDAGGDPAGAIPDAPLAIEDLRGETICSGLSPCGVAGIDVGLRLAVPDVPLAVDDLGRVALQLVHLPGEVGEVPPRAVGAREGD